MAFTLRIENKNAESSVNFGELLRNCKLNYGSKNQFYVLDEGVVNNNTAILYNPARIGRGIFYDGRRDEEGIVEISMNLPTTGQEITDFINVVKEIERQLEQITIYNVEEEKCYTLGELESSREKLEQFSLESLNRFCSNQSEQVCILTLAMFPLYLTDEQVEEFSSCTDLKTFEEILHSRQSLDAYYANPSLHMNNNNGKICAFYTLTEDCLSVFPIKAETFLYLDYVRVDEAFIRFYIYSEDRVIDGFYSYSSFIECMMMVDLEFFDREHVIIPPLFKEQIEGIVEILKDRDT